MWFWLKGPFVINLAVILDVQLAVVCWMSRGLYFFMFLLLRYLRHLLSGRAKSFSNVFSHDVLDLVEIRSALDLSLLLFRN